MAHQDFIGFLTRLNQDTALRARVMDIPEGDTARCMRELIEIAAGAGFHFTDAEVAELFRSLARTESEELSDAQLDAVAGGLGEPISTAMTQQFNLQYLMLQQAMQQQSRQYSMISNIMRSMHDQAMGTIQNLRA